MHGGNEKAFTWKAWHGHTGFIQDWYPTGLNHQVEESATGHKGRQIGREDTDAKR